MSENITYFINEEQKEIIKNEIEKTISSKGFLDAARFPEILKLVGIENYKLYSETIADFITSYFAEDFETQRRAEVNNKIIPCIIIRRGQMIKPQPKNTDNDSKICLDSETIAKIKEKIEQSISVRGFCLSSLMPGILKSVGIDNYKQISENMTMLINDHFSEWFLVKPNLKVGEKNYPNVILPVTKNSKNILMDDIINKIGDKLQNIIEINGYILTSLFPNIINEFGISDYREYTSTVAEFFAMYFPGQYKILKNYAINDCIYPSVIVANDEDEPRVPMATVAIINESNDGEDYEHLEKLFMDNKYLEFVTSPYLLQVSPDKLSLKHWEMALECTSHLLEQEKIVKKFNKFQLELLRSKTGNEFIKKHKTKGAYSNKILEIAAESSIAPLELPKDYGRIIELLNNLGRDTKPNTTYAALTTRFENCMDNITPNIYLLRALTSSGNKSIEKCITDYCNFLKKIKNSKIRNRVDISEQLDVFTRFLKLVHACMLEEKLSRSLKVNIMSVYLDFKCSDKLRQVVSIIGDDESAEEYILDLMENYKTLEEKQIIKLFDSNVSFQLLEKCIATIWDEYSKDFELPTCFLNILGWIIKHSYKETLDEIVRYHYSSNFTKKQKQIMLLNSLPSIIQQLYTDNANYLLCEYIVNFVYPNMKDTDISVQAGEAIENWEKVSSEFYNYCLTGFHEISTQNEIEFTKLFHLFYLNEEKFKNLQQKYSQYYVATNDIDYSSEENLLTHMQELYEKTAYDAIIVLFEDYLENKQITTEQSINMYIDALLGMQEFSKTIQFAITFEHISADDKENAIIRAISGNFSKYGMSQGGLFIFNDKFDINDAIMLLKKRFNPNSAPIIMSLIVLYAKNNEMLKSAYLYAIYQSRYEVGYTRVYAQLRSSYREYNINGDNNHYNVIEKAFYSLSAEDLYEFLQWASQIPVPDFGDYHSTHVFDFFFKLLLSDPQNVNTWKSFLKHMLNRIEDNSWLICVCGAILMKMFSMPNTATIRDAFSMAIDKDWGEDIPENLLYIICPYIISQNDEELCKKLYKSTEKNEYILTKLYLNKSAQTLINEFVDFCSGKLRETSELVYFSLITTFKKDISGAELLEFAQFSENKLFFLKKLYQNFIDRRDVEESLRLLQSDMWNNLSYQEREMFNLLNVLYENDDVLLCEESELFSSEEEVQRFKMDCAQIVVDCPSQARLIQFDEECTNYTRKLLVYSYVFGVVYNEDIYHKYSLLYDDMKTRCKEIAYYRFMRKSYLCQLVYNASFTFFYKEWRYLKLFITKLLEDGANVNDNDICTTMTFNKHADSVLYQTYLPFKEVVLLFWSFNNISLECKKHFIYALMHGQMKDFIGKYSTVLSNLPMEQKETIRRLIAFIDSREACRGLFEIFSNDIYSGNFETVLEVAEAISSYAYDTIYAISLCDNNRKEIMSIFKSTLDEDSHAKVVDDIVTFNDEMFKKYENILIPLICSRQFPMLIYLKIRTKVAKKNEKQDPHRYEKLFIYMDERGNADALAIYNYLCVLFSCTTRDVISAQNIIEERGDYIFSRIPKEWENEWKRIHQYISANETSTFSPDRNMEYDVSGKNTIVNMAFVEHLAKKYEIKKLNTKEKNIIEETFNKFSNQNVDIQERIISGISLLLSMKDKMFASAKTEGNKLPSYNEMAVLVGFLAMSKESAFSADIKLFVLLDVFEHSELSLIQKDQLFDCFKTIQRDLSVESWVENRISISKLVASVDSEQASIEIGNVCESILKACPNFLNSEICSSEEILDKFESISYIGVSNYITHIRNAVEDKKIQIKKGIRLSVKVENVEEIINDGFIYFCIQNLGTGMVNLYENCNIKIAISNNNTNYTPLDVQISDIKELRPGWITGCRKDIRSICQNLSVGETLQVSIKIYSNNVLICHNTALLKIGEPRYLTGVPTQRNYYFDKFAVGDSDERRLYGREGEQEEIKHAIETGKAIIYGASRIGKTSLINWVINDHAVSKGNVITLLFGGEGGKGKETDYTDVFYDKSREKQKVPYDDNYLMSEYLLIDTIKYGLLDNSLRRAKLPNTLTEREELFKKIDDILSNTNNTIVGRYQEIDQLLQEKGYEIWLIFDEFQQVVENWQNVDESEPDELIKTCNSINEIGIRHIKLIFCGSDELLRQMALDTTASVWRKKIFETSFGVFIGPLKRPQNLNDADPYKEMIAREPGIMSLGLEYSLEALEALCIYTGRVPLYGKEICNTVLSQIAKSGVEGFGRKTVYTYDIAMATQELLLDIEKHAFKRDNESDRGLIVKIFDAVTKGLSDDTDKQYLWYMAKWFMEKPNEEVFPFSAFTTPVLTSGEEAYLLYGESALRDALKIATVRGIIRGNESEGYTFSTLFYYNAFCGTVENLNIKKIFAVVSTDYEDQNEPDVDISDMSVGEKKEFLWNLYHDISLEDKKYPEELRGMIGNTQNIGGDVVEGGKTVATNIQINAEVINTAFNTLLGDISDPTAYLSAFKTMPTLNAYIDKIEKDDRIALSSRIEKIRKNDQKISAFDKLLDGETDTETIIEYESKKESLSLEQDKLYAELEETTEKVENDMISDTMSTISFDDLMSVDEDRKRELLCLDDSFDVSVFDKLPNKYKTALSFAISLHNIFDKIYSKDLSEFSDLEEDTAKEITKEKERMDFCPVAIMYCKIVEAMLKDLHTPLYIKGLCEKTISTSKRSPAFSDIDMEDTSVEGIKKLKQLSIGSYATWLVYLGEYAYNLDYPQKKPENKDFKFFKKFYPDGVETIEDYTKNIESIISNNLFEDSVLSEWKKHAKDLKIIHIIRNRSAHEAAPITKENFDWLIQVMFGNGELMRIWELSRRIGE